MGLGENTEKELIEAAKELTKEIYTDVIKPGAIQVGKAFGTVLGLTNVALAPVDLLSTYVDIVLKNYQDKLADRLQYIPIENIKPIEPEIAGTLLKNISYNRSLELEELFLNLLESASITDKEGIVHPSFANIISDLTSDEAKILQFMKNENTGLCTVGIHVLNKNDTYSSQKVNTNVFDVENRIGLKGNSRTFIENLIRLGIISKWGNPTGHAHYKIIETYLQPYIDVLNESGDDNILGINFKRSYYDFTNFGRNFIESCLPNKNSVLIEIKSE